MERRAQAKGLDIPEKLRESITEEFAQVPYEAKVLDNNGLGLGLSIVERLVSKIGGSLSIKSTVDRGSIFSIKLPPIYISTMESKALNLEHAVEYTVIPQITLTDPQTTIILLVDEDRTSRDAFTSLESDLNLRIISGSSSKDIIKSYADILILPKLVVVNTSNNEELPLNTVNRLNVEFNKTLPVILLSSDEEAESILYQSLDHYKFLQKPVTLNQLQKTISRLLEQKVD